MLCVCVYVCVRVLYLRLLHRIAGLAIEDVVTADMVYRKYAATSKD